VTRKSYRVKFPGGTGDALAGIVDHDDAVTVAPVAVFSHCFTCNKDLKAIVRISRRLAELGVTVLRFDMTGLGGSEGEFAETRFTTNLADLSAAVEFAQRELGAVTTLIGHSFGGAAALALAGTNREFLLRSVVTLATPSDTVHMATLLSRMNPDIEKSGSGEVSIGGRNWTIRRNMLEDFRRFDLPAAIAQVNCPALLFHSPDDETLSLDHALRIMRLIQNSPDTSHLASLITLHGADHLLVDNPADLELVAAVTAAFIHRYADTKGSDAIR